jgi:hypothetical protein
MCCCADNSSYSVLDAGNESTLNTRLPIAHNQVPPELYSSGAERESMSEQEMAIAGERERVTLDEPVMGGGRVSESSPVDGGGDSKDAHNRNLFVLAFALCAVSISVGTSVSYFDSPVFQVGNDA